MRCHRELDRALAYHCAPALAGIKAADLIAWPLSPEAQQMVRELKAEGISLCAMVTGDRTAVATMVAGKIGIDDFRGDCLPQGKVEYVEQVKKNDIVAFVGDGVNDAPALAAADLSIAMGAIGSDIAINSASIALMTNDLRRIPLLITLSKKSAAVINQNLVFGMFFVICGIVLSVFGQMSPILAAVLHTLSTLIVIFNSARLVRTGEEITLWFRPDTGALLRGEVAQDGFTVIQCAFSDFSLEGG